MAQAPVRQYVNWSQIGSIGLYLVHLGCFIAIIVLLGRTDDCVNDVSEAGVVLDHMHRALIDTRVIDEWYKISKVRAANCTVQLEDCTMIAVHLDPSYNTMSMRRTELRI
jgi:hypothetical protein